MKIFSEKEAEDFLRAEGFVVVKGGFVSTIQGLRKMLVDLGFPVVMKAAGKEIIHKTRLGGVQVGVKTYSDALHYFMQLRKIHGAQGVVIQKQVSGAEFLIGVKKTPDFGLVIGFGSGGTDVEQKKDITFRIAPINISDVRKMMNEIRAARNLAPKDIVVIENIILKVNELVKKYPQIKEMDINPLMVQDARGLIVDARIVWD
jgi:hypothetical protein